MVIKNGKKFAKRVGRAVVSTAKDASGTGLKGTFKRRRLNLKPSTRKRLEAAKVRFRSGQGVARRVNNRITAAYS